MSMPWTAVCALQRWICDKQWEPTNLLALSDVADETVYLMSQRAITVKIQDLR